MSRNIRLRRPKARRSPPGQRSAFTRKGSSNRALLFELLEPRQLLSGTPIISEFLASNKAGLKDSFGVASDWLEIANPDRSALDLTGWKLKCGGTTWALPSMGLGPYEYRVIFCSGRNLTDPSGELHTNFNLGKTGDNLYLIDPGNNTVQSWTPYPGQQQDVSYGVGQQVTETKLVPTTPPPPDLPPPYATLKYVIPTNDTLGLNWTQRTFTDTSWTQGSAGIGFANLVPGFAATVYKSNQGSVGNLAAAQALIATPGYQAWKQSETAPVINYLNTGGAGRFANDRTLPGMTINADQDFYAMQAVAKVRIPSAGNWTFGLNSDDGGSLKIAGATFVSGTNYTVGASGGDTVAYDGLRGASDTLGVFSFPAAGDYDLTYMFFENAGGSSGELWAGQGTKTAYDATCRLVGDTANGGLSVATYPATGSGNSTAFASAVRTDVRTAMQSAMATVGGPTSLYTRVAFDAPNRALLSSLTLKMKYDDGYVAYLNGVKVAWRNAPANPAWNSVANGERTSDISATTFENIDLTANLNLLQDTGNVLAVQVLLSSAADTDLLMVPELSQIVMTEAGDHFFATPSPGAPNTIDTWQPDLTFSQARGFYYAPFDVTLATTTTGAAIRYTLDGSTPSATVGTLYNTVPIHVTTTTTLRAVSVLAGQTGVCETRTYIFPNDVIAQPAAPAGFPANWTTSGGQSVAADYAMDTRITTDAAYKDSLVEDLLSLPTMSIVTDYANLFDSATGLYVNPTTRDVKKPASIEYYDPATNKQFQINAGLCMQGGVGREPQFKKHSFRVIFSSTFGPTKLEFPLFDGAINVFDNFTLRSNFNDAWVWGGANSQYIRDAFGQETFLAMGGPGSHTGFVHLYINGLYWGLYNPLERPDTSFTSKYLGGEKTDWDIIHCGSQFETVDQSSQQPWNDLMAFLAANDMTTTAAYQRLLGNNPDGTRNPAYPVQLDVNEYIDYMLMNFYAGNTDWPHHNYSMAFPKAAVGTGAKGLSWDTEWTLGMGGDQNTDMTGTGSPSSSANVSTPYYYLKSNTEFQLRFADHAYKHLFNSGALTTAAATARYQQLADTVQAAIVAEAARWGDVVGTAYSPTNWIGSRDWILNTFMPQRTAILLNQLKAANLYPAIDPPTMTLGGTTLYGGTFNPGDTLTLAVPAGTIYYTLDGSDPRLVGGTISPSAIAYTGPITLTQGVELKARVLATGVWSALADAGFYVNLAPFIRITELMYNPGPATAAEVAAGYTDDQQFEFVEIKNIGTQTLPLQGLRFSNAIDYTFPSVSIAPNQYLIVASDPAAFKFRYPGVTPAIVLGPYVGHFDNGGEKVELDAPNGGIVHEFTYNDTWYKQTDGEGFSLTVRDPLQALSLWDKGSGWRSSAAPGGSPGTSDTLVLPGSIIVNEVLSHTSIAPGDMIEFYNTTDQPIDISGWFVSDSNANLAKYRIAAGTTIAAHGYYVLTDDGNFGLNSTDPGRLVAFALSEHGDEVHLSSNAGGVPGGYREDVDFGAAPNNVATGQYTKSTGGTDFTFLQRPTFGTPVGGINGTYPGAPNSIPYISPLVFNDIMYNPPAPTAAEQAAGYLDNEQFEYVELYNRSDTTLALNNYYAGDGIGFTFGWYPSAVGNEVRTLESGATATWTTGLSAGSYTAWVHLNLVDGEGTRRNNLDDVAQYLITWNGGSTTVSVDQNQILELGTEAWVNLGTYSFNGPATVRLTRGNTGTTDWTIADSVKFTKDGSADVIVGAPALSSFSMSHNVATLAPGAYLVLVSDYAAFNARYNVAANNIPVAGVYTGRLDNGGEMLRLYQAGNLDPGYLPYYQIDHMNYGDAAPWVAEPDGTGASLIRVHTAEYGNDPANWEAGAPQGSPGAANVYLDRTPPTVPAGLSGSTLINPNRSTLTWSASTDSQTSVHHYVVYRNGVSIGTATGTSYTDSNNVQAGTAYAYQVSAVNRDGYESAKSAAFSLGIPGVSSIGSTDSRHIDVVFSEPLNPATAGVLGNYSVDGGITLTAVALSRGNTKVTLTTAVDMVHATAYTVTMINLTTASGNQLPATQQATFTFSNQGSGSILREYWLNAGGGSISGLTSNANYPNNPTGKTYPTSFEAPTDWADNYGTRMRGYLFPPQTGNYTFWIASDDNSELWLSADDNPANKVRIAYVSSWTPSRSWTTMASQQSSPIALTAGRRYYVEALQSEGGGGDNLAVRWQLPDGTWENGDATLPIPGTRLSPYGGSVDMTPPPAPSGLRGTATSTQVVLNWAAASDPESGIDRYVIYRDGLQLATATATTYTDTNNIASTSRHWYQVSAVNYDGFEGPRTAAEVVAPTGIAAITTSDSNTVRVSFSEPLDAVTAGTAANYAISGGITVSSAQLQADNCTVVLTTTALGSSSRTLTVNNLTTRAGSALPPMTGTFVNAPIGWSVTVYQANFGLNNTVATAQSVVNTPSYQTWVRTETVPYLDYIAGGHFSNARALPGNPTGNFVVTATGSIHISTAGNYTFGTNSDDGFQLKITGANFASVTGGTIVNGDLRFDGGRGASDTLGVVSLAVGDYPVSWMWFQGGGGYSGELFAAAGSKTSYDSTFRLVGDAANGGLVMQSSYSPPPFSVGVNALGTGSSSPALSGTVTDASATVTVRVNGTYYAATNNGNGTWTLPQGAIQALATGTYDVLACASNSAGQMAFDSALGELIIDGTSPTAGLTPVAPDPRTTPVDSIAFQFSEAVMGFSVADFHLTLNGLSMPLSGATLSTADNIHWTLANLASLTSRSGTYLLTLPAGTAGITDLAGNPLTAGLTETWVNNAPLPTATIGPVTPDPRAVPVVSVAIQFSAPVTGPNLHNFILTRNGGPSVMTGFETLATSDYVTWTLNGLDAATAASGAYVLTLSAADANITDAAGNPLAANASDAWSVNLSPLTVTINQAAAQADPTNAGTINFTVVFNQPVLDFATGDVTLGGTAGATTAVVSGNGTTYNVAVSGMTADGTVIASLAAGVAHDSQNYANAASASTDNTVTYDATPPTVTISNPSAAWTTAGPITYTVTYADANFDASTLAVANVTLNRTGTANGTLAVSGSGLTRTVTISGITGDGTLGISLAAATASDLAGNLAPAAGPSSTFIVDNEGPTISLSGPSAALTAGGPITYTVTYAGDNFNTSTLSPADITLNRTGTASGAVAVSGSGMVRTVTISGVTGNGTLGISIAPGTASDMVGHLAPGAGPSATFAADNTQPTIALSAPSADYAKGGPITYTVTYADANFNAATLAAGNVTLNRTGTANGTVAVSGSGLTRTVTVSGITGDGTLGISIAGGTASDRAGNLAPAIGPSTTFTVDNTAPAIAIGAPSVAYASGGPMTYTVTYADANFSGATLAVGHITLNRTGTANGTVTVSGAGATRTVAISSITGDGTLGISIAAGTGSDLAGNLTAAAGPSATFSVDNTPPTIAVGAPSAALTKGGPVTYTITYADANFNASTLAVGDVTLNRTGTANGTIGVSGTGLTRTVTISGITGDGALGISVAAGTASDLAGNTTAAAGPSATFSVDNTPPAIALSSPSVPSTSSGPVTYTVTYADANFNASTLGLADITLNRTGTANGALAVSGSGLTRTVTISGITGDGSLGISVAAGTASDLAGNLAPAAGPSSTFTVDNSVAAVLSINRRTAASTSASSVLFDVTFSEAVTGVDRTDFALALSGATGIISAITGSGASYAITVANVSGVGTLGLNLVDNNSITDAFGGALGGQAPGDGSFTGQVYNVDTTAQGLIYWLKPIAGGSGDYSVAGSYVGGDPNLGHAYTVSINSLPAGAATVKFQLYASVRGADGNAANDSLVSGVLDILNTPDSTSALVGQPNPVTLTPNLDGTNSSGGQVNSDIDGAGGLDLGGPLSIGALPGTGEMWVRPFNSTTGVAGTALNSRGRTDILLGTFTYTYGAAGGVLGGQATKLWPAAVTYTGGGSGKYADFWRQDNTSQRESDGTKIGSAPAVTIMVKPQVSIGSISQPEGNAAANDFAFPVTLSMPCAQPVQVTVDTADGTARVADNDYEALHQIVTFAPGETSKTVTVRVTGNELLENDEAFTVSLSNVTGAGATLGAASTATGTIRNDDGTVLLDSGGAALTIVSDPDDPTGKTADLFFGSSQTPTYVVATTAFGQFHIVGGAGVDQVTLDFSRGCPLPSQGLLFDEAAGKTGDGLAWKGLTGSVHVASAGPATDLVITAGTAPSVQIRNVSFSSFEFVNGPANQLVIDGAALKTNQDNAISASAAVALVNGGELDLGNKATTVKSLALTDGRVVNGMLHSPQHALGNGEISAALTGGSVVKSDPGTSVLSGNNSYEGGTQVLTGVLWVAEAGSLPRGGALAIGPGATVVLQSDLATAAGKVAAVSAVDSSLSAGAAPTLAAERAVPVPLASDQAAFASTVGSDSLVVHAAALAAAALAVDVSAPVVLDVGQDVPHVMLRAAAKARAEPASPGTATMARAARDAALLARKADAPLLPASWMALVEAAMRSARSSEKTGPARAALDEVLARFGL